MDDNVWGTPMTQETSIYLLVLNVGNGGMIYFRTISLGYSTISVILGDLLVLNVGGE